MTRLDCLHDDLNELTVAITMTDALVAISVCFIDELCLKTVQEIDSYLPLFHDNDYHYYCCISSKSVH